MSRPIAALFVLTALAAGCASPTTAPIVQRGAEPGHTAQIITVQRGDTAAAIAARLGVSVDELLAANGLPRGTEVRAGQMLRVVPSASAQAAYSGSTDSGAARGPAMPGPRVEMPVSPGIAAAGVPPAVGVFPPGGATTGGVQLGAVRDGEALGRPLVSDQLKTGPKGLKRPYSDATLAELSRSDDLAAPDAKGRAAEARPSAGAPGVAGVGVPGARAETRPADEARSSAGSPSATAPSAAPDTGADSAWVWPGSGRVLQPFEEGKSKGMVLGGKLGDPVVAAADGRVIFSGPGPRGYGNLVILKHANDLLSVYAHNRAVLVKEGTSVKRGQRIAELGDSDADRPKLHFEVRRQGKPIDPVGVLPAR